SETGHLTTSLYHQPRGLLTKLRRALLISLPGHNPFSIPLERTLFSPQSGGNAPVAHDLDEVARDPGSPRPSGHPFVAFVGVQLGVQPELVLRAGQNGPGQRTDIPVAASESHVPPRLPTR